MIEGQTKDRPALWQAGQAVQGANLVYHFIQSKCFEALLIPHERYQVGILGFTQAASFTINNSYLDFGVSWAAFLPICPLYIAKSPDNL